MKRKWEREKREKRNGETYTEREIDPTRNRKKIFRFSDKLKRKNKRAENRKKENFKILEKEIQGLKERERQG